MTGTYLHVMQPVLTFLDPFLPELEDRAVDVGEFESSAMACCLSGLVPFHTCCSDPAFLSLALWNAGSVSFARLIPARGRHQNEVSRRFRRDELGLLRVRGS